MDHRNQVPPPITSPPKLGSSTIHISALPVSRAVKHGKLELISYLCPHHTTNHHEHAPPPAPCWKGPPSNGKLRHARGVLALCGGTWWSISYGSVRQRLSTRR